MCIVLLSADIILNEANKSCGAPMRIIRQSDLVEKPWKNGGGITRDIAAEFDGETLLWRLSMADVDSDGPFSVFAGLTRVLTVIKGGGMILQSPDSALTAEYAQPVTFDGASPITAKLTNGSLTDFNLMYATARVSGTATALHGPARQAIGTDGQTVVIHCIQGRVELAKDNTLGVGDTVILTDGPVPVPLQAGSSALCITLTPLG